ncbi:PLP-dependent aminotransferase family protein [Planctomonas sp. JC2975]|uniref:MocR-like pyridoxine biosynthesis transcription factor PdxR n=1 Tax=Planctomonas sp. JC2975 TaxID=2729626 RepID=UPI0014751756|nr:PLP-dependent aminotransferase family protein [Planctomonas sp. JC2975]NNC12222.1 PLP-dependent aminotransferase family protein [Planctomonas sp. JC2975]
MANDWANLGRDLHLVLDPRRKTDSLEAALRDMIRDGRLVRGVRLPASRGLAVDLGIARNSVAEVYERLVGEGWLESRVGAGTWVASTARIVDRRTSSRDVESGRRVEAERGARAHARGGSVQRSTRTRDGRSGADAADEAGSVGVAPDPTFDLRAGIPDTTLFPREAWTAALRRAFLVAPASELGYGHPHGLPELREALTSYLGRARGVVVEPSRVHVTHGAGHAMRLIAMALVARGARRVAVEEYGHEVHRDILAASGLEVVPVPVDDSGAVVDGLGDGGRVADCVDAVLLTPAHQFPTGVALSPARRAAVAAWAERTGALIIEDDYDGEFRFDRRAVGALQSLAPDHVAFIGTASKALGPGIGLGWCVLPGGFVTAVADQRRLDGARPGALTQLALAEFLEHGDYDRSVRSARARYRDRRRRVEHLVEERMPAARVTGMAAGLQCLLELPDGIREEHVSREADAVGLALAGLRTFRAPGAARAIGEARRAPRHPAMVVGFGAPAPHRFDETLGLAFTAIERARDGAADAPNSRN